MRLSALVRYWLVVGVALWGTSFVFAQSAAADDRACGSIRYPAPSGKQSDIEFVFDRPYRCGVFANGDWWVSSTDPDGVKIVQIKPDATDGLNGFEINPDQKTKQGFDRRVSGYDEKLLPVLPFTVRNHDASVVKAVSIVSAKPKCRPCLQFAAVLTVLRQPPADSGNLLRPGYFGSAKVLPNLERLKTDRLGFLTTLRFDSKSQLQVPWITSRYRHVQLDHLEDWVGRDLHPQDNLPDYGADIARDNAVSALRMLLSDFDATRKFDRQALVAYLQMGVDLRSMSSNGVRWLPNGGHGNGRKLPLLFAGHVLDDPGFFDAVRSGRFSEDDQVYRSVVTGQALFGLGCSDEQYWMTTRLNKGKRDCRDPYGYIDGGGHEIGEAYQKCCTAKPWKYTALAIDLLGLREAWGNDAFFEYVDRWVSQGVQALPDPCAPFNGDAKAYGKAYGPALSKGCVKGGGRYPEKHAINADTGFYDHKFGEAMWARFKK